MIGEKTFTKIDALLAELLATNQEDMKAAYARSEDGKLTVALSIVVFPGEKVDDYELDATINFVKGRVKMKISAKVSETQIELPLTREKPTTYKLTK